MDNKFIQAISNLTYTENDALTYESSGSALVDLFFHGAAIKNTRPADIIPLFEKAFEEDTNLALKVLFYLRDCRNGQGERLIFHIALNNFLEKHPEWFTEENVKLIPEYGRWDDLFLLVSTDHKEDDGVARALANLIKVVKNQIQSDLAAVDSGNIRDISLISKWAPSITTKGTRKLGYTWCEILEGDKSDKSQRLYRKKLSKLRAALQIVESKMSAKEWDKIDYSKLPSLAAIKYIKAFHRNDGERYQDYLDSLKRNDGSAKINTSTLYPYDIVHKIIAEGQNETLEQAWKNLPDYVSNLSGLVVADVSGSMRGKPLEVCLSLAMYISERNKNPEFKDKFITFSANPQLQSIVGSNLSEKIRNLSTAQWDMNTNLQRVFDLVLDRAKAANVPQEDMPAVLLLITDMEFDEASDKNSSTNLEVIKQKYADAGYTLPKLVFWNVNSHQNQTPGTMNDKGVYLVGGCSPIIMKYVLSLNDSKSMLDLVKDTVNSERYKSIKFN